MAASFEKERNVLGFVGLKMRGLAVIVAKIDAFSDWTGRVVGMLLLPMVGALVYEVIARYVFDSPTKWVHETTLFAYATLGILAGGYTFRHRMHVNMDLFYGRLLPRQKAIIDSITVFFFFLFCGILLWKSWGWVLLSIRINEHTSTPWGPLVYPIKMMVPIGAFLILLQGVAKFIRDLVLAISGRELR